jgi:uncharacterized RDD family membrane protein YckC
MKCPKCQYISFDSQERCRNCGYEFALTIDMEAPDLPIQTGDEAIGPLGDLALTDHGGSKPAIRAAPGNPGVPQPRPITSAFDLPLFKDRSIDDDAPLVTPPAVPRTPLSVRRSNPVIGRAGARAALNEPVLDLEGSVDSARDRPLDSARDRPLDSARDRPLDSARDRPLDSARDRPLAFARDKPQASPARPPAPLPHGPSAPASDPADGPDAPAGAAARLLAASVDAGILGSIGAAVLYFTLKVCGLQFSERGILPPVPFTTFLLLLGGGYFVLFTAAGGQTIGKMATGIKVVSVHGESPWSARVPLADSMLRALGYLVSLLPAGLGFLPALFGAERRAVHDRLADTRVVKA